MTWAMKNWIASIQMSAPRRIVRALSMLEGDPVRLFIGLTQSSILSPRVRYTSAPRQLTRLGAVAGTRAARPESGGSDRCAAPYAGWLERPPPAARSSPSRLGAATAVAGLACQILARQRRSAPPTDCATASRVA